MHEHNKEQTTGSVKTPSGLTFVVLQLISVMKKNAFGVQIRERLSQQIEREVPAAQVYVTLRRLEDAGFVEATEEQSTVGRKGRPRRIYQVTALGQRTLQAGTKLYGFSVPQFMRFGNAREEDEEIPTTSMG
jgi:DNA-binding PadR family transcriptional regulator